MTPQDIVDKAREYIGTPFHHGARVKGEGIDCVQLLIAIFNELGADIADHNDYSRFDEFERLIEILRTYCDEIYDLPGDESLVQNGDILAFRGTLMYNHCGIYCGGTFVHAYASPAYGKVIEEDLTPLWKSRVAFVFRFRGVSD